MSADDSEHRFRARGVLRTRPNQTNGGQSVGPPRPRRKKQARHGSQRQILGCTPTRASGEMRARSGSGSIEMVSPRSRSRNGRFPSRTSRSRRRTRWSAPSDPQSTRSVFPRLPRGSVRIRRRSEMGSEEGGAAIAGSVARKAKSARPSRRPTMRSIAATRGVCSMRRASWHQSAGFASIGHGRWCGHGATTLAAPRARRSSRSAMSARVVVRSAGSSTRSGAVRDQRSTSSTVDAA